MILQGITGFATLPVSRSANRTGVIDSRASAGAVVAVVGPSGAGKTTLIDVLAGRRGCKGVGGEIRINGRRVPPGVMADISGYVLQDDVFPGTSTVEVLYLLYQSCCFQS